MRVCGHPTPSLGVWLTWRPRDQSPSDPPGSEPCWACITTISLSHTVRTEEQFLEFNFYIQKVPFYNTTLVNKDTAAMPGKVQQADFSLVLSSWLTKLEISFHLSHSLQWDHWQPAITSYCTFITVRFPVCEPPVETLLYLPATNQYGECRSISHGKEGKKQPCCY